MKLMFQILFVTAAVGLVGCASTQPQLMNRVNIGMTKQEVIAAMGKPPTSTSAQAGMEYLIFNLVTLEGLFGGPLARQDYFVRLRDGRVESYGRIGDFDSAPKPPTDVNVNPTK